MNNFKISKNTKWKEVEINGENREIPNDWELKKLNTLSEKIGDGLHGTPKYVEKSNFYFINGNNLNNGKISFDNTTKFVSEEEYLKHKKQLSEDTILLSINGTIGNLAFYNNENVVLGKSAAYINTKNNVNKIYLFYFFKSDQFKKHIEFDSTGSTIKNLSLTSLRSFDIVYPPLCQQSAIADILSTQESIIQDIESLISKYETRLRYLSEELLSGRLRIKEVDGKNVFYKNTEWKEVEINGEMKEIPVDWDTSNIYKQSTIQFEKPRNNLKYLEIGDIDVKTKRYDLSEKEKIKATAMKFVSNNTLLISTVRPTRLGFTLTKEDLNVSSAFVKIKSPIQDFLIFNLYTVSYLNFLNSNQAGATYPTIKEDILLNFEFPVSQEYEIYRISKVLKSIFEEKEVHEQILEKEKKKLTLLLNNLLSGKYLVSNIE